MQTLNYGKNDTARSGIDLIEQSNTQLALIPLRPPWGIKSMSNSQLLQGYTADFSSGSNPNTRPEASISYEIGGRFDQRIYAWVHHRGFYRFSNLLGSDFNAAGVEVEPATCTMEEVLPNAELKQVFQPTYCSEKASAEDCLFL